MKVVGGTYREEIVIPKYHMDLGGSGFRAAAALGSLPDVTLVTATDPEGVEVLDAGGHTMGIAVVPQLRDMPVAFSYLAPFVEPIVQGRSSRLSETLRVEAESVLAFGMVESGRSLIKAETLVYDPQSVSDPGLNDVLQETFASLSLIGNAREIGAIGTASDVERASARAAQQTGASVVVVKAGARGVYWLDVETGNCGWEGAIPTSSVTKIGSGDFFSAAFAGSRLLGADPLQAVRVASRSAAWACATGGNLIPPTLLAGHEVEWGGPPLANDGVRPRVYLAGPFFTVAQRWLVESCKAFLEDAGADVFSPVHEVGHGGQEVAALDLDGLDQADVVFALLDEWDVGTVYECGWASRKGVPVVGVAARWDEVHTTMLLGSGAELHTDLTTAMYRAIWRGLGAPADKATD